MLDFSDHEHSPFCGGGGGGMFVLYDLCVVRCGGVWCVGETCGSADMLSVGLDLSATLWSEPVTYMIHVAQ